MFLSYVIKAFEGVRFVHCVGHWDIFIVGDVLVNI